MSIQPDWLMIVVDDPVEAGLVQSLARPGTNFTGVTFSMVTLLLKKGADMSMPEASFRTARTTPRCIAARQPMSTRFSGEPSPAISQSSSPPASSWSSTPRRLRLSG